MIDRPEFCPVCGGVIGNDPDINGCVCQTDGAENPSHVKTED